MKNKILKINWIFLLVLLCATVNAEEQEPKLGRLPDGRAYRIDQDGNQLVDYIAELELERETLNTQVKALENEVDAKVDYIESVENSGPGKKTVEKNIPVNAKEHAFKVTETNGTDISLPDLSTAELHDLKNKAEIQNREIARLQAEISKKNQQLREASGAYAESQKQIASEAALKTAVDHKEQQVVKLNAELEKKTQKEEGYSAEIQRLKSELEKRNAQIEHNSQALAARDQAIKDREQALAQKDIELREKQKIAEQARLKVAEEEEAAKQAAIQNEAVKNAARLKQAAILEDDYEMETENLRKAGLRKYEQGKYEQPQIERQPVERTYESSPAYEQQRKKVRIEYSKLISQISTRDQLARKFNAQNSGNRSSLSVRPSDLVTNDGETPDSVQSRLENAFTVRDLSLLSEDIQKLKMIVDQDINLYR